MVDKMTYTKKQLDFMGSIKPTLRPERSLLSDKTQAGILYGASAISNIANAKINYDLMKVQNQFLDVQANQIELQAMQEINQAREQFNEAMGNLQYQASQRGIKQSSGSLQRNIEISSKNFNEDMKTIKDNSNNRARSLRSQQSINKKLGRGQMLSSIAGTIGNTAGNLITLKGL